jgi:hypothetical protein
VAKILEIYNPSRFVKFRSNWTLSYTTDKNANGTTTLENHLLIFQKPKKTCLAPAWYLP